MSRLDSFINRMTAQRDILNHVRHALELPDVVCHQSRRRVCLRIAVELASLHQNTSGRLS